MSYGIRRFQYNFYAVFYPNSCWKSQKKHPYDTKHRQGYRVRFSNTLEYCSRDNVAVTSRRSLSLIIWFFFSSSGSINERETICCCDQPGTLTQGYLFIFFLHPIHYLCTHFFIPLLPSLGVTQIQGNLGMLCCPSPPPHYGTCLQFYLEKNSVFLPSSTRVEWCLSKLFRRSQQLVDPFRRKNWLLPASTISQSTRHLAAETRHPGNNNHCNKNNSRCRRWHPRHRRWAGGVVCSVSSPSLRLSCCCRVSTATTEWTHSVLTSPSCHQEAFPRRARRPDGVGVPTILASRFLRMPRELTSLRVAGIFSFFVKNRSFRMSYVQRERALPEKESHEENSCTPTSTCVET